MLEMGLKGLGKEVGTMVWSGMKQQKIDMAPEVVAAKIADAVRKTMEDLDKQVITNKADGAKFMEANGKLEGIKTTKSGLQYKVIKAGEGAMPGPTDVVTADYEGRMIDEAKTVFDSSYKRGEPAQFPLNRVIPGWSEALQLMNKGAKFEIYVPSELGYGLTPPPQSPIGPNAVLIFTVELLSFEKAPAAPAGGFPEGLPDMEERPMPKPEPKGEPKPEPPAPK
jgi:FKBP-type peptidyl-prolyl cis-trans isomerase